MIYGYNKSYQAAMLSTNRILTLYGGAGSGKSYFAGQKKIKRLINETPHRILLIRKVHRTIKGSQFQLLKDIIYHWNAQRLFTFNNSDYSIKYNPNGNTIISCGVDDPEKLKSIHGITGIWIEEATELSQKDFQQINLRLRGETKNYKQIILTFNPISSLHWLNKIEFENCFKLKTTYLDNKYIDEEYKTELENLIKQDINFYNIYTLGEWGILENVIYKPFEILNKYPDKFDEVIYGLDFGYNHKTSLIKIGILDNEYFPYELIYENKQKSDVIIKKLIENKVSKSESIYCDSARPDMIDEIKAAGFNALPSDKSVKGGINFLKCSKIYSHHDNAGLNEEVLLYSWKKDKNGNVLDEPIKFKDDAVDALRYGIYSHHVSSTGPAICDIEEFETEKEYTSITQKLGIR